jgi:beta-mannosidase
MEKSMKSQSLAGKWQFRQSGVSGELADWMPAQAPGGVHTDLMTAGKIPDPFVADHEKAVMWVAESDWEYRCVFRPQAGLAGEERLWLVFDGLDTVAEVRLNGQILGKSENMFRRYAWEVKDLLADGENELLVAFSSPVKYMQARFAKRPLLGVSQAIEGAPYIRKAPCQFGWDWGPMLPPVGIWKDVRLEGRSAAKLENVHLRQAHTPGKAIVSADLQAGQWDAAPLAAKLILTAPDGAQWLAEAPLSAGKARLEVTIEQPQLWWPNGYGAQPLYDVEVRLEKPGQLCDQRSYKLGLRTLEHRRQKDQWGESFTFVVNGVPVFAKGANWIPADSFPTRLSDAHLERLIRDAAATHQNMLRVWGGGFYEEDRFYDLCDRYGILVWQDGIFACSIYPLDQQEFLDNLYPEVIENVRRLRHHACLALWCGNNEMEQGWESWGWARLDNEEMVLAFLEQTPALHNFLGMLRGRKLLPDWKELRDAYEKFFYTTLAEWIAQEDPDTAYWTSSPSSNSHFVDVNGVQVGDTHNWEVWHGNLPFKAYRQHPSRFVSEFGFQSLPALATVCTYAEPKDWNMTSYIMEHHQRNAAGNSKIITYMTDHFRMPKDFPALVYLTQLLQAEAVRTGVEFWRRSRARTSGALYWQLNDCWPVASWASIDYFGRWKALHYSARRFYAPLLLSVHDEAPRMEIHLTSDLVQPWQGEAIWSLESLDGSRVLASGQEAVNAAPLADTVVCALDFSEQVSDLNQRELVFICELRHLGQTLARQVIPFVQNKHLALANPQIETSLRLQGDQLSVELRAKSLARFVEISLDEGCESVDTIFSDNYFDLPAGRSLTVTCQVPAGWDLEQARRALRLRSLVDSY